MNEMSTQKHRKIHSYDYKKYQFLIVYGFINLFFFRSITSFITSTYTIFEEYQIDEVNVDGTDVSTLVNVFAMPFLSIAKAVGFVFLLTFEIIAMILFSYVYVRSEIETKKTEELSGFIMKVLVYSALISFAGALFWNGLSQIRLFFILYLPIPLLAFLMIYIKLRKQVHVSASQDET